MKALIQLSSGAQALRRSFYAEVSSRFLCGVVCAITYYNTQHQCRKLFLRYSISCSSFSYSLPTFQLFFRQTVTHLTKFHRVHICEFSECMFDCNWFVSKKKLAIEKQFSYLFRYNINLENGTVNILPTVASIQCGSGNVMRYMEILPASLMSCFRQIFPTDAS